MTAPQDVLDFWFGVPGSAEHGTPRQLWFRKSEATDEMIRARFGVDVEAAVAGQRRDWQRGPRETLALVILLDQFTRNIFRDTPRAFAGDPQALELVQALVQQGADRLLAPVERWFVYLPFEHAESLPMQEESVRLCRQLVTDGHADALVWAQKHYDVIARFGRFPHRNQILGRVSTPDEIVFLQQPGSRF